MSADFFFGRTSGNSGGASQGGVTLRPQPPLAKRLNRNALTVAAVIMGMTVLTAIVVLNPNGDEKKAGAPQASSDEAPPVPPRPAFLDEPVRAPNEEAGRASEVSPVLASAAPATGAGARPAPDEPSYANDPYAAPPSLTSDGGAVDGPPPESARDRAYQAALSSSVVVSSAGAQASRALGGDASGSASEEDQLIALGDSIMRSALRQTVPGGAVGAGSAPAADAAPTAVPSSSPRTFSSRAVDAAGSTTLAQLEPAGSPYTLRAGTVIPGLLITGINSDLPGEIVGQVSRDVYDSRTLRIPLIPKGSRLIGTYDNQVAAGHGRLLVAWTRIILPDGRSMRLPGLALTDPAGQSGAKDKVDNHWRRVFGNALLLSAISAGVQLSQPPQASVLSAPSSGQVAAGAIGQELSNVALEILRRGMDVAPTITIRAGQPFNVFLSGDLVFDGPYDSGP